MKTISFLAVATLLSFNVSAVEPGPYFEGAFVRTDLDNSVLNFDRESGLKLVGGYNFNQYFGVELEYIDAGKFDFTIPNSASIDIEITGFNLSLLGYYPVTEKLDFFAKVGGFRSEVDVEVQLLGLSVSDDERDTTLSYGAGIKYAFTKNLFADIQYQKFQDIDFAFDEDDLEVISVGVIYRF